MRSLTLAAVVLMLGACASDTGYRYPTRPTPEPAIAQVTLNRPFPVRPDRASEFIQYGRIVPYNQVSEYYPHCIFGLRTVSAAARTVRPETFTVTGIHRDRFMAWLDGLQLAGGDDGGDYGMVMSSTRLDLQSATQPEVFRLTCQQLDEPWRMHHLSLQEMQQALGELFTLR